jgi:hypothetical protein
MLASGESRKGVIRPDFNRSIMIDFMGATITSDVGFLLMREIDDRFKIIAPMGDCLEDLRSPAHCGLWEVVGTPTEGVFSGNEMAFQVTYEIILCRIDKLLTMISLKFRRDQFHNQFLNCVAQGWGIISVKSRE